MGLQWVRTPDQLGLITLDRFVVAPRPSRAWRALVPNTVGEERRMDLPRYDRQLHYLPYAAPAQRADARRVS